MPHLLPDSTAQQHQHMVPPVKPTGLPELFSNESSICSSPVSYSSSPLMSYSPASPVSGASSPAKNGKKKGRNRPPKHVRKSTAVAHKLDELQIASPQHSLEGSLAANIPDLATVCDIHDTAGKQSSNRSGSRVTSTPINVPLRLPSDVDEPKLEAFSSPKWLGTGFSDKANAAIVCPVQHCSETVTDVACHNFTYFARSLW